jgi:hypothetical protein
VRPQSLVFDAYSASTVPSLSRTTCQRLSGMSIKGTDLRLESLRGRYSSVGPDPFRPVIAARHLASLQERENRRQRAAKDDSHLSWGQRQSNIVRGPVSHVQLTESASHPYFKQTALRATSLPQRTAAPAACPKPWKHPNQRILGPRIVARRIRLRNSLRPNHTRRAATSPP